MDKGTVQLKTERLILRRHDIKDAEILYRNYGCDPQMYRYSGWNPYATPEATEESVRQFISSYDKEHFYSWAIEYQGRLIGTAGAYDHDPDTGSIEIGLSIERASWGKGFAGESLKAVLTYLMGQEGIRCVKAWCASDNIASGKVMEKAGMRCVEIEKEALEIDGKKYDKLVYESRNKVRHC
jgi:ribosomal-protein-alanine N-acetyltransferase